MTNNTLSNKSLYRNSLSFLVLLSTGGLNAETRFDFNTEASTTQADWTSAPLGIGTDGTVTVATIALGGLTVDSRDRGAANGGGSEAEMWQDFIFANGSFAAAPDSGLQITLSGLEPESNYDITLWAFDRSSGVQADGFERAADWSSAGGDATTLAFDAAVVPETLLDYRIVVSAASDINGQLVLDGIVSETEPSSSHNVFLNGLVVSDPVTDVDADGLVDSFEQLIIDADENDAFNSVADVLPGDDFDNDASSNEEEQTRGTDPVDNDSDDDLALDGWEDGNGTWVSSTETGSNPLVADTDGDGILDGVENRDLPYDPQDPANQPGTDPNLADSDGDTYSDDLELIDGTDPTDPESFLDPVGNTLVKFDFNAAGSPTQEDWTTADLGNGTDGTITIATEAIGAVTVDVRDRTDANTNGDGGDTARNDLWRDFVFANGSSVDAPETGLKITLTGLAPQTTYPIIIWGYDDSSNNGRAADWGPLGMRLETLTFPTTPDPSSLSDYQVSFEADSDATGTLVIEGLVAAENPIDVHNVFINALAVGQPTGSTQVVISDITFDADADTISLTWNSIPGNNYALRFSPDLIDWSIDIDDQVPATENSDTTTFTFNAAGLPAKGFFRIE